MNLDALLEKRLIILTGKGGVGKSLVASLLGVLAARRGKRTLLAEVDAPVELARYFDAPPVGHREIEVAPSIFAMNIDPEEALDDYVRHVVKFSMFSRRILGSPIYRRFFAAAPGLDDLMTLGKIMTLQPRYDLVVLDAPATGHGLYLLKAPQAALRVAPLGPIGSNARRILELLRDRKRTAIALVAIPEEMAAVEAVQLARDLSADLRIETAGLFLNACHERRFTAAQEKEVLALFAAGAGGSVAPGVPLQGALRAARHNIRRRRLTQFYDKRLRAAFDDVLRLPYLYEMPSRRAQLEALADRLSDEGGL